KIEIRESSEESDAAASVNGEEEETLDQQEAYRRFRQSEKPTKLKTVSFPNEKKREMRRKLLVKRATKKESSLKLVQKQNAMKLGFTKPDVVRDRVKERTLRRIATSGVAQLFNAVTERQKTLDVEIQKQQKGGKLKKEKLSATLNFGPPGVVKPKKEEVEDWLNDSHGEEDVKEEAMEQ
ncbi:hypothetical protein PENTCL1PPCAC_29, partial [Pristionchus entomophagus]